MAQNGIEILIDVLAQQGIDSLDALVKVLSTAYDRAGVLAGSVDDLDASLGGLSKSGLGTRDMAVGLVSAFEDAGVVFGDAEGAVTILSGALKKLGVAGKEAGSGVDLTTKANEELIGPTDSAAAAVERQAAGFKAAALEAATYESAMKGLQVGMVSNAIMQDAAVANLGAGYAKMTNLAAMATPALMKAATWAGIGLAGLAYEGIKQYTQFNKLITQTITQAGVAPSKFGFLSNLAEVVAQKTGQGLADVANTIYRVASGTASWNAGLGATKKQLTDIVSTVSKLNVVGGIAPGAESEQASRVVTALLNANIRGVGHNATSAAALVNAVVGSGDMRLADLVPGIGRGLLSSAVANNMTAQDAMAWVATLTSQGTTASVAGNYVKTGVNLLAHPSAQGVSALAMLGIKPGELENLMQGPGGLVAALSTLKQGMQQLNPGSAAKFFYHEAGKVYPGGSGLAGAVAKLQTWSAGELSPKFLKDWEAGKLTPLEQTQATDLILTKAFGGSKQFATIAAVINKLPLVKGIEAHITAENTRGYFNAQYARTAATPAQQFKMMHQSLLVDLVKIGKELTPLGLTFGHVMTGTIGALSKFKGVIVGFALLAGGLLAAAGIGKMAQLGSHLAPLIGAGYTRLGHMMGEKSAFTTAMSERANAGGFKFLNIYGTHKGGILSKLGGESINAGILSGDAAIGAGGTVAGLSKGENVLNSTMARSNGLLADIARNTGVTAAESKVGGAGGVGGKLKSAESQYAPQFKDPKTGRFLSAAESAPLAARAAEEANAAQTAAIMYGSTGRGRGIKSFSTQMMGGADAALSNVESMTGGLASTAESIVPTVTGDVAKTGMMAGLGETLGGLAGGPVGMMAMMAAPMLMGLATPLLGKLGGLLGNLFGGGSPKPFHARIRGSGSDVVQASAKAQKALKALHQFYTESKSKSGKIAWTLSGSAERADQRGYDVALRNYQLATHTYGASIHDSNALTTQAIQTLYGGKGKALSHELEIARGLGTDHYLNGHLIRVGTAAQMMDLAMHLPKTLNAAGREQPLLRRAVLKMMSKQGANWQDFEKIISKDKSLARGTLYDATHSSAQWQAKHAPLVAALVADGYFNTRGQLALNTSEMMGKNFLHNKHLTVAEAAKDLPGYAHQYQVAMATDRKALLDKNLPADARKFYKDQRDQADKSFKTTEALLKTMQEAAKNTHLAGDSVDKMARETAAQIAASGLTAQQIGAAVGAAIKGSLKTSSPQGTGTGTTRTVVPGSNIFSPFT